MTNYPYKELGRLAGAVRNVWASLYNGGFLPGMSRTIGNTGDKAFLGLQGDVIEVIGGGIFSGMPLQAIISMMEVGVEEAERIQAGYGPYDMKPGFLKSPKAKSGKKGKYMIIPFRHMTSGTSGKLGKPMLKSVHQAAKSGSSFEDQTGTKEDPSDFGLVNSKGYEWQNGAIAGMTNTKDEGKKHSTFHTFRVVSENSDPNSWWHPGVDSNNVIGSVVNYVKPYIKEGLMRAAKAEVVTEINKIFNQSI